MIKEKKASLFGMIGAILFLLVIFILLGLTVWQNFTLSVIGSAPRMHVHATVVSSDYSNDCDIYLLGLLRYQVYPNSNSITYAELMSIAKHTKQGKELGEFMLYTLENQILKLPASQHLECFQIRAKGMDDKEPFIDYKPYGPCEEKTSSRFCEAYVPDRYPENGYIKIEMAVEAK